jgi:hypothetical protein
MRRQFAKSERACALDYAEYTPGRDGAKRNPHEEPRIMAKIEQLAVLRQGVGIWRVPGEVRTRRSVRTSLR